MARKDIVVIGSSAGGVEALVDLTSRLPGTLRAAVFIVNHVAPGIRSVLPAVLGRTCPLAVEHARDGEAITNGRIYVAPPDHHLLLDEGRVRVAKGPKENRARPAVDPLFRSAAYIYGPRVIGVVLSGALGDGTAGLWTIKLRGGTTVAQDPRDAKYPPMPSSALENVEIDYRLRAQEIGLLLARLTEEPAVEIGSVPKIEAVKLQREVAIAGEANGLEEHVMNLGELSPFTCPDCHGVLTRLRDGKIVRYRCHTGHAFSQESLLSASTEQVEARLWDAVRAVDETVILLKHLGDDLARAGNGEAANSCYRKAREAHERSRPIRDIANGTEQLTVDGVREDLP